MGLNLKNDEAHRLAKQIARLTGENMTEAVTQAMRERLERLRNGREDRLSDRLLAIGRDCSVHMREPFLSVDHGEFLYGEDGLPR